MGYPQFDLSKSAIFATLATTIMCAASVFLLQPILFIPAFLKFSITPYANIQAGHIMVYLCFFLATLPSMARATPLMTLMSVTLSTFSSVITIFVVKSLTPMWQTNPVDDVLSSLLQATWIYVAYVFPVYVIMLVLKLQLARPKLTKANVNEKSPSGESDIK